MSAVVHDPLQSTPDDDGLPLAAGDPGRILAFVGGRVVTAGTFLAQVRAVAALLPDAGHAVNLCQDRYLYLVAFCAVALRGQATLMPPSRTRAAIDLVRGQFPDSYCIGDAEDCGCDTDMARLGHYLRLPDPLPRLDGPTPRVGAGAVAAIGFTSGSTGTPSANAKTWGSF